MDPFSMIVYGIVAFFIIRWVLNTFFHKKKEEEDPHAKKKKKDDDGKEHKEGEEEHPHPSPIVKLICGAILLTILILLWFGLRLALQERHDSRMEKAYNQPIHQRVAPAPPKPARNIDTTVYVTSSYTIQKDRSEDFTCKISGHDYTIDVALPDGSGKKTYDAHTKDIPMHGAHMYTFWVKSGTTDTITYHIHPHKGN